MASCPAIGLFGAWAKFLAGGEVRQCLWLGVKLMYWGRIGKAVSGLAGLVIIFDILGEKKVNEIGKMLEEFDHKSSRVLRTFSGRIFKYMLKALAMPLVWVNRELTQMSFAAGSSLSGAGSADMPQFIRRPDPERVSAFNRWLLRRLLYSVRLFNFNYRNVQELRYLSGNYLILFASATIPAMLIYFGIKFAIPWIISNAHNTSLIVFLGTMTTLYAAVIFIFVIPWWLVILFSHVVFGPLAANSILLRMVTVCLVRPIARFLSCERAVIYARMGSLLMLVIGFPFDLLAS